MVTVMVIVPTVLLTTAIGMAGGITADTTTMGASLEGIMAAVVWTNPMKGLQINSTFCCPVN